MDDRLVMLIETETDSCLWLSTSCWPMFEYCMSGTTVLACCAFICSLAYPRGILLLHLLHTAAALTIAAYIQCKCKKPKKKKCPVYCYKYKSAKGCHDCDD